MLNNPEIGISILNPVDIDPDFLDKMVDECIRRQIKHIQIDGPMHHRVHANIDGSINFRKYAQYNQEKDQQYIKKLEIGLPPVLRKAIEHGVEIFFWHHEVEIPDQFINDFPDILNSNGDVEASSPILEDFIRNKINDFFSVFPDFTGLVITLHETVVPLLKLPNQKLSKTKRIEHICRIILSESAKFNKKVIFRPFASLPEDCQAMSDAFNAIGNELEIMTKWTQFDWNLHLPPNREAARLGNHPMWLEGDINGEYFGQGRIPCVLRKYLKKRMKYFADVPFPIKGVVVRTDRNHNTLFGGINEVNLQLTQAFAVNLETDSRSIISRHVDENWGGYSSIKEFLLRSEELVKATLYINGFYFSAGSYLPDMFAVKNHYYFDIINGIKGNKIDSDEWFIPENFKIPAYEDILVEKNTVLWELQAIKAAFITEDNAKEQLNKDKKKFILSRIDNFIYLVETWTAVIKLIRAYKQSIDCLDCNIFNRALADFRTVACRQDPKRSANYLFNPDPVHSPVTPEVFAAQIRENFDAEFALRDDLRRQSPIDYIIPASCLEGHSLQKEVNFSDNELINGQFVRYLGKKGKREEGVNILIGAYGWLEYELSNPNVTAKMLAVTFYTGGKPAKAKISFPGTKFAPIIYDNPTPEKFDTFEFCPTGVIPEKLRIKIDKLSKGSLGVSLVKLKGTFKN